MRLNSITQDENLLLPVDVKCKVARRGAQLREFRTNAFTLLYRGNIVLLETYMERGLSPSLILSAFVSSMDRESRSNSIAGFVVDS